MSRELARHIVSFATGYDASLTGYRHGWHVIGLVGAIGYISTGELFELVARQAGAAFVS